MLQKPWSFHIQGNKVAAVVVWLLNLDNEEDEGFMAFPKGKIFILNPNQLFILKTTLEECPEMMPAVHMFELKFLFWENIRYQM